MDFESVVAQVLMAAGVVFAAAAAFGKEAISTAKREFKTLGIAVAAVASAFLVEVTGWLDKF